MTKEQILDSLALLEEGRLGAEVTEAQRQVRYKNEDAERVIARAREDAQLADGMAHHDAKKAELEAALNKLTNTPEKVAADQLAALTAKVAAMEAANAAQAAVSQQTQANTTAS